MLRLELTILGLLLSLQRQTLWRGKTFCHLQCVAWMYSSFLFAACTVVQRTVLYGSLTSNHGCLVMCTIMN